MPSPVVQTTGLFVFYIPMDPAFLAKFALNGLIAGSLYAVLALGLALIYGVLRFVNLAHGEIALTGAFSFYTFYIVLGWPIIPSAIAAMALLFVVVILIEKLVFLPVRDAPSFIPLIISIGLGILLRNLMILIYQPYARTLSSNIKSFTLGSDIIRITDIQIIILISSIILMLGLWMFLKYTKIGRCIRATSDNKEIAAILGINVNKTITIIFLISAFLAGSAGILATFDQNLHPNLGSFFTIKSFAAVILGGIGSIPGAVLGGYLIGFAENILIAIPFNGWYIPSSYKDAIAFLVLILILYIKPTGFFGKK
ncbi:branched-chain amino acid ABC transporter permease [Candidatus Peregrinibacteria bacterium]|nr:branched-chain amino acid ABC transporter permease [Candidatus Peregrinibacteria bacterium]